MGRLKEMDFLRGIGVFAVIIIHLTSTYITYPADSSTYLIWGSINRFFGFAVPLFLAISALVMTYKAKEVGGIDVGRFYLKRLSKVIFALLIWTGIYLVYLKFNGYGIVNPFSHPGEFIKEYILLGHACYHLYFIPIIIQLYLLFPLIWKGIECFQKIKVNFYLNFLGWFTVLLLTQWLFAKINQWYIYEHFTNTAVLLASYVFPVGMGIWLGFNWESFCKRRSIFKIGLIGLFTGIAYWYINGQLFNYRFYLRILPMLYMTLAILTLIILVKFIKKGEILKEISKKSFFIYLVHPLIMYIMEINFKWEIRDFTQSAFINYSLDFLQKFVIVFGISYVLAWAWETIKKLFNRKITGEKI